MRDFIVRYWLEVLFGLLFGGLAFLVKNYIKNLREAQERHFQELLATLKKDMDEQQNRFDQKMDERDQKMKDFGYGKAERAKEEDVKIHQEISELKEDFKLMKGGLLSLQGRDFKRECRRLLENGHIISLNEFEGISSEHDVYNSLGGNHEGDALFELVKVKYHGGLKN